MIKRIKLIFLTLALLPFFSATMALAASTSNNPLNTACTSNDLTKASAICKQAASQGTKNPVTGSGGVLGVSVSIISIVAAVAAIIMMILGGFAYITSSGNVESAKKARDQIIGAAVGLVIIGVSWSIVEYVVTHVIG